MEKEEKIYVECDAEIASAIKEKIDKYSDSESKITPIKGIGGGIAEAIVFGTLLVKGISAVLELLIKYKKARKAIKSLKIGKDELENPTKEDIIRLKEKYTYN